MYDNSTPRCAEKDKTKQQKDKAIQCNSPEAVIFQIKIGCLGWDSFYVHVDGAKPSRQYVRIMPKKE